MQDLSTLSVRSLAVRTLAYALVLAVVSQAAQTGTTLLLAPHAPLSATAVALDLVGKSTWSAFVCVGLAVASAVVRGRWQTLLALTLVGLVAAWVGVLFGEWIKARLVAALGQLMVTSWATVLQLSWERGRRYLVLGFSLGLARVAHRQDVTAWLAAGAAAGLVGGAMTLARGWSAASPGALALDLVFPVGCALVVWSDQHLRMQSRLGRAHGALREETRRRVL